MPIVAKGYDSNGKVMKCSFCDKEAGGAIVGIHESFNYCIDHSPFSKEAAKFVYKKDGVDQPINWPA